MLKAGRAGSSPDDIANSQPFQNFLNSVGRAVDSLNSIAVGLDAVENGYAKPDSLDISWNPSDRKMAARTARKFALESVLVRVGAANKDYFDSIGKLSRFKDTYKSDDKSAPKFSKISKAALGKRDYHTVIPALIFHWRNRIVHSSDAKLTHPEKMVLFENAEEISARYASLSVNCLLCHFEERRPTLKDVSSLTAMSINLLREIDGRIQSELSKEDLDTLLDHYDLSEQILEIRSGTKPDKVEPSIDRLFRSRAPLLLNAYRKIYPVAP